MASSLPDREDVRDLFERFERLELAERPDLSELVESAELRELLELRLDDAAWPKRRADGPAWSLSSSYPARYSSIAAVVYLMGCVEQQADRLDARMCRLRRARFIYCTNIFDPAGEAQWRPRTSPRCDEHQPHMRLLLKVCMERIVSRRMTADRDSQRINTLHHHDQPA